MANPWDKDVSQSPASTANPWDKDVAPARHGATGSWEGFGQGVKDAVTAPFKGENWKSLTDNPIVNPIHSQMESPDLLTPENNSNLASSGKLPSPYQAGGMVANTVMAGTPEVVRSGAKVIPFRRIGDGVSAAAPSVAEGAVRMLPFVGKPLAEGAKQVYSGIRSGMDAFRGPLQGPEMAPTGYKAPYPTLPYEQPLPATGPRPAFEGHDFTPPVFDQSPPVGQPGAVLPSGSVVGPAPPSRVNPPLPHGNAPRVPVWQRMSITGEPLPGRDLSPIYPSSPILESGRVIGPRPSLMAEPNRGTVINGSSQSTAKPVISQPDLDALNQQLRDSLKARGVVSDTPASVRSRANASRAKFDENGKRNQLKSK